MSREELRKCFSINNCSPNEFDVSWRTREEEPFSTHFFDKFTVNCADYKDCINSSNHSFMLLQRHGPTSCAITICTFAMGQQNCDVKVIS